MQHRRLPGFGGAEFECSREFNTETPECARCCAERSTRRPVADSASDHNTAAVVESVYQDPRIDGYGDSLRIHTLHQHSQHAKLAVLSTRGSQFPTSDDKMNDLGQGE